MDTGDITIVTTLGVGFITILLTLFMLMRQSNNDNREQSARITEIRTEIRGQGAEIRTEIREQGSRISEVEREQARLEGYNAAMSEMVKQQAHTHEVSGGD